MIRVLVCDNSSLVRCTLKKIIDDAPGMELIDTAQHGAEAIQKAIRLNPDVITMAVHMPLLDGFTALKQIVKQRIAPVIMISSAGQKDANAVVTAMQAGAFDFMSKPEKVTNLETYADDIVNKIKEAAASNLYEKLEKVEPEIPKEIRFHPPAFRKEPVGPPGGLGFKVIVLGTSTGGPKSIYTVLPLLPADLNAAVILVQHMPPAFLTVFAHQVGKRTLMECEETESGMRLKPGKIFVAKGGVHLKLTKKKDGTVLVRHSREPYLPFMPSVDVVMKSVVGIFGQDAVGVLMTGMGRDGAEGMVAIMKAGGTTIAESEETSIVFGMPQEAIRMGGAQKVLPNHKIAEAIIHAVTPSK